MIEKRHPDELIHEMLTAEGVLHSSYIERDLGCPECRGRVELVDGKLICVEDAGGNRDDMAGCTWSGTLLAELVALTPGERR